MKQRIVFFPILCGACLLVALTFSCRRDNNSTDKLNDIVHLSAEMAQGTKGSVVTGANLTQFAVFGYRQGEKLWSDDLQGQFLPRLFDNVSVNRQADGSWSYDPPVAWGGLPYDYYAFLGYAPKAAGRYQEPGNPSGNNLEVVGDPTSVGMAELNYETLTDVTSQIDLLACARTNLLASNKVTMQFGHTLSQIRFTAWSAQVGVTPVSIAVNGIKYKAKLSAKGNKTQWTIDPSTRGFELRDNFPALSTKEDQKTDLSSPGRSFMLLPQDLTTNTTATIEIMSLVGGVETVSTPYVINENWEAGKTYTYVLKLGGLPTEELVVTDVLVTDWIVDGEENMETNPEPYVDVNGLRWAKGNLVSDGAGGCKIGTAVDYGLYFQFGSLVGWSGGANGDGTGKGSPALLSQKVKPTGYTGGSEWISSGRYLELGTVSTGYGLPAVDDAAAGIGDPCRYYLGSTWRTPTADEYLALLGTQGANTNKKAPLKVNSYNLTFPGSGLRTSSSGAFSAGGSNGICWSSSISTLQNGLCLDFGAGFVRTDNSNLRMFGFAARCVSEVPFKVNPPKADQVIEIDGLKWTKGNLVAAEINQCKVGAPTDYGLYFHFGSLIGWAGGANGDGTGTVTNVALIQKVKPTGYSGGTGWTTSGRYLDGTIKDTGYGLPSTDAPATGIGDPCRYYLGDPWRTPTADEYLALVGADGINTNIKIPLKLKSYDLAFPASGFRDPNAGALIGVGSQGFCWSSSIGSAANGLYLNFNAGNVNPQYTTTRVSGFTSRCVSGTYVAPFKVNPPAADQVIEIDGLKWTKGNLVAAEINQCKVGASTDYGLYFQFGSLIGWTGGANGDGTGAAMDGLALSQKVKPTGYSGGTGWTTSGYYKDGTIKDTGYGLPATDAPATGIGDACRYYLGAPWRTPTADEYLALLGANGTNTNKSVPLTVSGLAFPGSGYRLSSTGELINTDSDGGYWNSSVSNSTQGMYLLFGFGYLDQQLSNDRVFGFTSRCVSGTYAPPFKVNPPTADQVVEIDGLKWTKGNLVASNFRECKVGTPTDYGLYFHFGSLIGWTGGANGDGTGAATNGLALSQKVKPTEYSGSATWPAAYYTGGTEFSRGYGLPSTDDATTGIGDPCRYYLGASWRTPTTDEYTALVGANGENTDLKIPLKVKLYDLTFPGSGFRGNNSSVLTEAGSEGLCWSSSVYRDTYGLSLRFATGNAGPLRASHRAFGYTSRCVSGTYVKPLKWATGNLVADGANGCKVGSPTDYGLYFQFGSLIGWTGGANGDGTGVTTTVGLSQKVKPSGYTGSTTWPAGYYKDGTIKDTGDGLPSTDAPATGIGDACRYYLGSPWRTPTAAEYLTLLGTSGTNTDKKVPLTVSGLAFPGSGYREYSNGALANVGSNGGCWSSSISNTSSGLNLSFSAGYVFPQSIYYREYGFPLRCVQ